MPEIAHNGTVRPTWTAGLPSTLCQRAQKSYTKAHSSPFLPPTTYPRNIHNGTFVPVSAAHDVPKNRTRPYPADRRPDTAPRQPGPSHFCLIEPKLTPGADGGPCTPKQSAGPRGPAPQARPGPSGPDPARAARAGSRAGHGQKIRQQNAGTLRPSRTRRQPNLSGQLDTSRPPDPGFCRFEHSPKVGHGACTVLGSFRPLRVGRVGVRTPRQAEPEPDTDLRTTLAPTAQVRLQIVSVDGMARRHDGGKSKVRGTRLVCRPTSFPDLRTPWPHGPWPHVTNESDLGSRLTLDRGILELRSEFGRAARIRGCLVSGLPPRVPDRAGTLARYVHHVWAASDSCPRPSTVRIESRKAPARAFCCTCTRLCYGLLCLHAPFCCALRRFFKFLLYLQALFCCALRRLFAVPTGAFGHGSAALAFTHKNENKHGRSHGSPESSRPWRAARRRPTSRPFQIAEPRDGSHGRPVPYQYARAGIRPRQTSDRAGRRAEQGHLPRIEHARRHRIRTYAPPRDEPGRRTLG